MRKLLITTVAFLLLLGCASSGPRIATNVDASVNFSAFKTYNLMQPLSTDRSGVRTPLSNMLANSMGRELENRGFRRSDNPDILINFFVNTEQRLDVRQVPTAGSFHGYRRNRYRTWGSYETRVREYTQGTLAVDVVDPARNMLVWEGVAQGRLRRSDREITQERIDEVVGHLMVQFGK